MFRTYQEYVAAATALLQNKPKGAAFKNATGQRLQMEAQAEALEAYSKASTPEG